MSVLVLLPASIETPKFVNRCRANTTASFAKSLLYREDLPLALIGAVSSVPMAHHPISRTAIGVSRPPGEYPYHLYLPYRLLTHNVDAS